MQHMHINPPHDTRKDIERPTLLGRGTTTSPLLRRRKSPERVTRPRNTEAFRDNTEQELKSIAVSSISEDFYSQKSQQQGVWMAGIAPTCPKMTSEGGKFSVLIFNVSHGNADESIAGITEDQKKGIEFILEETKNLPNLLILAQDRIRGSKIDAFTRTLKLGVKDYKISSTETAGIFLDNRQNQKCEGGFLPETTIRKLVGRVSAFVLELGGTGKTVLVVSYHGVNNEPNKVKDECLKELIQWAKTHCRRKRYFAFVIGGDFNRTMGEAKTVLADHDGLQFEPQEHFQNSLDFVITFPKGTLEVVSDPKVLKLAEWDAPEAIKGYTAVQKVSKRFTRTCKTHLTFDHPRVLFSFRVD